MSDNNNVLELSDRAERLIDAIAGGFMKTAQAAAERIGLASEVAIIRQRMAAYAAVLEMVGNQKESIINKIESLAENSPLRKLYLFQLEQLTAQEVEILQNAGLNNEIASNAIRNTDKLSYGRKKKKNKS
jgi:hypothetical protein